MEARFAFVTFDLSPTVEFVSLYNDFTNCKSHSFYIFNSMISLKQLLSENASNPMVPVQGIVAEFMSGVVQLSLLSLDNNSMRNGPWV